MTISGKPSSLTPSADAVKTNTDCTFEIDVSADLKSPFVYYKVGNFYANHRKYVVSRSYPQLRGKGDAGAGALCGSASSNEEMGVKIANDNTTALDGGSTASPCGLIAKYRFTDKFSVGGVSIDEGGIATTIDKNIKFKRNGNWETKQWLDMDDEHVMVWYQMETYNTFIKLWGKVDGTLKKGKYTVTVSEQWDISGFNGQKSLYFSTVGPFGGTNPFLGIAFVAMSFLTLAVIILLVVLEFTKGSSSKHYSLENLKW